MKNIKFSLLAVFAVLFLVSCSSSDDDKGNDANMSLLLGKWYNYSYTINGEIFPYDDHEECGKDYMEFLEGGIMRNVDVWECEIYVDEGTYSVEGDIITAYIYEQTNYGKIVTLDDSKLVIESIGEGEDTHRTEYRRQ